LRRPPQAVVNLGTVPGDPDEITMSTTDPG
jgi:hypothetical protein